MAVLVAVSGIRVASGSGSVTASGALTATGFVQRSGSGPIAATGAMTGRGLGDGPPAGAGSVSAIGSLSGTGRPIYVGSGPINATGTLTATGDTLSNEGSGSITATGTLTATGKAFQTGSGPISATGTLTATGVSARRGSGSVSATGSLTGSGLTGGVTTVSRRLIFRVNERLRIEGASPATATEISERLVTYVDDMNVVLAKNTSLQFDYDPTQDFFLAEDSEFDELMPQLPGPLTEDYYYVCWIDYRDDGQQADGIGWQHEDEISCGCYGFPAIWSESDVENDVPSEPGRDWGAAMDYLVQVNTILHEFGHAILPQFPELYFFREPTDNSGTLPNLTSSMAADSGHYATRNLIFEDPMVGRANANDIDQWLAVGKFCPVNAAAIDAYNLETVSGLFGGGTFFGGATALGSPAKTFADDLEIDIQVVDAVSGSPIVGAEVFMYGLDLSVEFQRPNSTTTPSDSTTTDSGGLCTLAWGGTGNLTWTNAARMFKVEASNYEPNGKWVLSMDLHAGIAIQNGFHSVVAGDFHHEDPLVIELTPT